MVRLTYGCVLLLSVGCPCDDILTDSDYSEQNGSHFAQPHLAYSPVVVKSGLPVGQAVLKHIIVFLPLGRIFQYLIHRYKVSKLDIRVFGRIFIWMQHDRERAERSPDLSGGYILKPSV